MKDLCQSGETWEHEKKKKGMALSIWRVGAMRSFKDIAFQQRIHVVMDQVIKLG